MIDEAEALLFRASTLDSVGRYQLEGDSFRRKAYIKLSSVASNALRVSGHQMLGALIASEEQLAELAQRRLRSKIPELRLALQGRVRDHHRFLLAG